MKEFHGFHCASCSKFIQDLPGAKVYTASREILFNPIFCSEECAKTPDPEPNIFNMQKFNTLADWAALYHSTKD